MQEAEDGWDVRAKQTPRDQKGGRKERRGAKEEERTEGRRHAREGEAWAGPQVKAAARRSETRREGETRRGETR